MGAAFSDWNRVPRKCCHRTRRPDGKLLIHNGISPRSDFRLHVATLQNCMLLAMFLLGWLPTWLVMRGKLWRLERRIAVDVPAIPAPPAPAYEDES